MFISVKQLSAVQQTVIILHPCRWAPWACKHIQLTAGGMMACFDERNFILFIMRNAKGSQQRVLILDIGI